MPTSKEFKEFILEKLEFLGDITARHMMGEYLLYYNGKLFGGIYDDNLLIKISKTNESLFSQPIHQIPYQGAKPMLLIDDLDNKDFLRDLIIKTCEELPDKK